MQNIELNKPIQVRTGDYRRKWADAKITSVWLDPTGEDDDNKIVYGLSFSVEFTSDEDKGMTQCVSDAFGWNSENWRYKEKSCTLCKWQEKDVGDPVPYGSTTVNLPECRYCVCPNVSEEEIEDKCESTEHGKNCTHFEEKP